MKQHNVNSKIIVYILTWIKCKYQENGFQNASLNYWVYNALMTVVVIILNYRNGIFISNIVPFTQMPLHSSALEKFYVLIVNFKYNFDPLLTLSNWPTTLLHSRLYEPV